MKYAQGSTVVFETCTLNSFGYFEGSPFWICIKNIEWWFYCIIKYSCFVNFWNHMWRIYFCEKDLLPSMDLGLIFQTWASDWNNTSLCCFVFVDLELHLHNSGFCSVKDWLCCGPTYYNMCVFLSMIYKRIWCKSSNHLHMIYTRYLPTILKHSKSASLLPLE